jgi:predicted permease
VRVHARLRQGVSREQATDELARIAAGLDETYPREATDVRRPTLAPATWIDPRARVAESDTVRMMLMAAGVLLLLVCANVGNLLLAVATGRRREMALRAALGASRGRLLRRVIAESMLLAGAAGAIAVVLAGPAAMRLGSYFARPSVWGENVARQMTVDGRVLGFALLAALMTSILAGLLPALAAGRHNLVGILKSGAEDGDGHPSRLWGWRLPGVRDLLVSAQVGLSVVLLVVAGLTLRTMSNVGALDSGFAHETMLASYVSTSSTGVTVEERDLWFRNLAERLTEEPWVRSASISTQAPLSPHGTAAFRLEGVDEEADLVLSAVIPGFFETLSMDVLRGRDFTLSDSLGAPDVAMVNQVLVERYFPDADALGRTLWGPEGRDGTRRSYEIVGVVSNARVRDYLADAEPVVYLANPQQGYASGSALTVATTIDPAAAVPQLYQWLRDFESHVAIVNVLPYNDVVRGFTYAQRMNAQMFSALALLGLVLAVVGIFSVMSLAVSQRTREIGVRMAIGAHRVDIGRMVVRRAIGSVSVGLVAGIVASLMLAGLLRNLLYGVGPTDPFNILTAGVVFVVVAVAAAVLPAHRAASVDPMRSLRAE